MISRPRAFLFGTVGLIFCAMSACHMNLTERFDIYAGVCAALGALLLGVAVNGRIEP